MRPTESTHASFLHRLRDDGDDPSWLEFHARYGDLLYRYARARGASHADAEDVVQDVEMQFFRSLAGFEYQSAKGRFRSYLRTSVINAMARRGRREAREPGGTDPVTLDRMNPAESDPAWEQEWWYQRLRHAVDDVADEFDAATIKAFEMHVLAACSARVTGEELGLSQWAVYRARDRVLRRLREKLDRGGGVESG